MGKEKMDKGKILKQGLKVIAMCEEEGMSFGEIAVMLESLYDTFAAYAVMKNVFGDSADELIDGLVGGDEKFQELMDEIGKEE